MEASGSNQSEYDSAGAEMGRSPLAFDSVFVLVLGGDTWLIAEAFDAG